MSEENNNQKAILSDREGGFINKLSARLKNDELVPYPRWRFLLKNYVVWAVGALALICGSLSITVMIYLLRFNDWEIRESTHKSLGEFVLLTMPYFWLIFLGLFIFILYLNIKHTKRGYRYPVWLIAISSILASVIFGSLLSLTNIGEKLDNILGAKAPFYDKVINRQMHFWSQPEEGRLSGIVVGTSSLERFMIIDSGGQSWEVEVGANPYPLELLSPGRPLNLIGRISGDSQFLAEIVRPAGPGKGFLNRPPRPGGRINCPGGACRPQGPPL